jgi:AcrR family transcriptional regulator
MSVYSKIIHAAIELASQRPVDQISYADVAAAAGVHWTTVRRHLGSKDKMRALLAEKQAERGLTNADTRTRVLDAAIRIFAKHGYAGATLDQVAAEAGLTKGAVYWHFSSKTDLYLAICERNLALQGQLIPRQAESILRSDNPVSALADWLRSQLENCMVAPDMPMLFFEFYTSSRDREVREKMKGLFEVLYGRITEVFHNMQEQGLLRREIDPASLAVFVQTVFNGLLLSWLLAPKHMEIGKFTHDAASLLWKGLSP